MGKVRVRFAPSPTGGLHLGGVRTALYNYLFAKKHNGDFIVRIEDTDHTRYVPGAEEYIFECLEWCGIEPNESVNHGGDYAPYRQSNRKDIYKSYAEKLIAEGQAYYAFDTPQELETMRADLAASGGDSLQYDHRVRMRMRNSLNLSASETRTLLDAGTPYVIRIKIEPNQIIAFNDAIRGEINFDTNNVDDKVLLKADGMPTYHLAVVVDDYLMKISNSFRGEEWLPSAPIHILLWKYLFGISSMPEWAHLPLILKPDGNGKLSKRDGERLGFPVFALNWTDADAHTVEGFREIGFLPEAFINFLAMLGWNDGTEQEIFSKEELIEKFSLERVHKAGAKFDYEKAKWYNHEWIKRLPASRYAKEVKEILKVKGIDIGANVSFVEILEMVKDRCTLLNDFYEQTSYFFESPKIIDVASIQQKWNSTKYDFFEEFIRRINEMNLWDSVSIEVVFKQLATDMEIKAGELQLPFRVMIVGGKYGPAIFYIAEKIGKNETIQRIEATLKLLK